MAPSFTATYEATPQCIALVRNQMAALAADCGLDEPAIGDVKLAVSEAATNALIHGYRGGGGTIRVEATLAGEELLIAVSDGASAWRPGPDSPGLGLGLPVIASVTKRLEILDDEPGTRLQMAFDCHCTPAQVLPS